MNRANRYEARCQPGGVLISLSTRERLGDLVEAREVTGLELKGVTEPVTAYQVVRIAPREVPE